MNRAGLMHEKIKELADWRAIDIHESDKLDEAALKDLIRAEVALNLKGNTEPKPRPATSKRVG